MVYLFAIIGLVALASLFWRAFGPQGAGVPMAGTERNRARSTRVLGPDDDPEFLRRLGPGAPPPKN